MTRCFQSLEPELLYEEHKQTVMDVAWNPDNGFLFGSVSDDRYLNLYDTRCAIGQAVTGRMKAHDSEINALAFNPINDTLLATGAGDKTIALIDTRNLTRPLHFLEGHHAEIYMASISLWVRRGTGMRRCIVRWLGIQHGILCWDRVPLTVGQWFGTFPESACHRQTKKKKTGHLSCSLYTEVIPHVSWTSPGIQMSITE